MLYKVKWFGRKQSFYVDLKGEWDMYYVDDLVECFGDLVDL